MSLSLLRFFFIVMDIDNVIAILFHILMRHITDTNIFFFSDLFSLFFFSFYREQISPSQVYLIRCQNHMSEAIREERSLT